MKTPDALRRKVRKYFAAKLSIPYREGAHDCCLLVLGWMDALTGSRLMPAHAGEYVSKLEGLRKFAPDGMLEAWRELMATQGWQRLHSDAALRPGDVVLTRQEMPAVFDGECIVSALMGAAGQARMPYTERKEAYRWQQQ